MSVNMTGIGVPSDVLFNATYGKVDCGYMAEVMMAEISARIGLFSWVIFAGVVFLFIAHVLKSRASKGKSHLASLHGEQWLDKAMTPILCLLFMASWWLVTYGGFGV